MSTGLGVFWRALMNVAAVRNANPLVQASRLHAYTLASQALPRMHDQGDAQARIDMCAAAFLQNRDEDDGGRPFDAHWIARSVYALAAALFNQVEALDQGSTHALLTGPAIRHFGALCPDVVKDITSALEISNSAEQAASPELAAAAVTNRFAEQGICMRLRDFGVSENDLKNAIAHSMNNFNADRYRELLTQRTRLVAMLRDAY